MTKATADSAASQGMALLQSGKLRDAELRFRQALSTDPRDLQALIGLGMAAILPSSFKIFSLWYPPHQVATMSGFWSGSGRAARSSRRRRSPG